MHLKQQNTIYVYMMCCDISRRASRPMLPCKVNRKRALKTGPILYDISDIRSFRINRLPVTLSYKLPDRFYVRIFCNSRPRMRCGNYVRWLTWCVNRVLVCIGRIDFWNLNLNFTVVYPSLYLESSFLIYRPRLYIFRIFRPNYICVAALLAKKKISCL